MVIMVYLEEKLYNKLFEMAKEKGYKTAEEMINFLLEEYENQEDKDLDFRTRLVRSEDSE